MNNLKHISTYLPFIKWISTYKKANLQGDISAGVTVAVMLIPQSMAYAMLAGLPPVIGLYASVIPLLIYALFGSSRQLAVGPVAMVSILVATGVSQFATPGSPMYIQLAIILAAMVGIIQFTMGIARLGFLVNFFSHPVISGFTSAAALIIGFSQLKHLLGFHIDRSHHIHTILLQTIDQWHATHVITIAIGLISILIILIMKKWKPVFPSALLVVTLATAIVSIFELKNKGVKVVGAIPDGLPVFALPTFEFAMLENLIPIALTIAFVGFMESISVAKALATRYRYPIDANQELVGLGLSNMFGSLFQAYPVTGGFSRSAVNAQAGAKTGLASIFTVVIISITLLFLTPLFNNLPVSVLAAIIMVAVFGLIDIKEVRHLWRVNRIDLSMLLITFFATLTMGIDAGIITGVLVSLVVFILRTVRPHYALLGRIPGTHVFRNTKRFPQAQEIAGMAILRIDASFYFGNVNFIKEKIDELLYAEKRELKAVLLDMSSVNVMDSSAESALNEIWTELNELKIQLLIANIKGPVRDVMQRSGLYQRIGAHHFFYCVQDAVHYWENLTGIEQKSNGDLLSEATLKAEIK
jgi:SulP family sulfate permease